MRRILLQVSAIACILHATPARAGGDEADACAAAAEEAQPKRRAGKLVDARAALMKCSRTGCPAFIRTDCTRWLTEVDAALGSAANSDEDAAINTAESRAMNFVFIIRLGLLWIRGNTLYRRSQGIFRETSPAF